ncbi:MAG: ABC transporter permease [Thiomonas sp. 14-64-326]|nr:MAG: ABC transporter permease [Thiomonas sp. 14-64-326]
MRFERSVSPGARSLSRWRLGLPLLLAAVVAVALSVGEGGWNADIVWQLRLPRVLAGMGVGALLAQASAQLILIGAMLAAMAGALSTLLLTLVPDQQLRGAMFWLVGNLSGATHGLWLCGLATLGALWLLWRQRRYDRLLLGSEAAWLLGEPVTRARLELVLLAALATGASVAVAGAVGFVGLVVPQALRLVGLQRMRDQAWAAPLAGAALVVAADTLARGVVMPYELPVGAVTALVGAPVFIFMLRRAR